jgi:hypothetical protein
MTPKGTPSGNLVQFAVRLEPEDYALLLEIAVKRGIGVSTGARLVINAWAKRKREAKNKEATK